MARIEKSILIDAPWEDVDAVANDGNRTPEWFEGVESTTVDDTFPEVGGVMEQVYKVGGASMNFKMTVTDYDRGNALKMKMEGMINGTQEWLIAPEGEGTRLTVIFDYDVPGGGLGAIADKLVIERTNSSNLEKSLANLKGIVEG